MRDKSDALFVVEDGVKTVEWRGHVIQVERVVPMTLGSQDFLMGCDGCIAEDDDELCAMLGECLFGDAQFIWIKRGRKKGNK